MGISMGIEKNMFANRNRYPRESLNLIKYEKYLRICEKSKDPEITYGSGSAYPSFRFTDPDPDSGSR
jgi:hypothetical protein